MQLREPEVRALLDCAADTASAPDLASFRELVTVGVHLQRALGEDGRGLVVVGPGGRLVAVGDTARSLLERIDPATLAAWLGARPRRLLVQTSSGDRLTARLVASSDGVEPELILLAVERDPLSDAALAARGLTHREAEVMRHVAAGATNDQIAALLELSPRTVQKHLEHVFAKLGVATRLAALAAVGGHPG